LLSAFETRLLGKIISMKKQDFSTKPLTQDVPLRMAFAARSLNTYVSTTARSGRIGSEKNRNCSTERLRRRAEPQQFNVFDRVEVEDRFRVAGMTYFNAYIDVVRGNDRYDVVSEEPRRPLNDEKEVPGDRIRPRS